MIDVADLLHTSPGFPRAIGVQVVSSSRELAVVRVDAGPELHNHMGGPHAAVIFGLGELTAFAVLLEVFGDLVEDGVLPLVKKASIEYAALITGPMTAHATLAGDEDGARASVAERGRASFPVDVVFRRESDGADCATAAYTMALLRPATSGD